MAPKIITGIVFYIILTLAVIQPAKSQARVKTAFATNSALLTHLLFVVVDLNSTSYELSIPPSEQNKFSTFTETVKRKNPSVTTLLSIGGETDTHLTTFPILASNLSYRKTFIASTMKIARLYGFGGLDLAWIPGKSSSDMTNMGILFQDWRTAIELEARKSSQSPLILTARVVYTPNGIRPGSNPTQSIQKYLDWIHVQSSDYEYNRPEWSNFTGSHAVLYNPTSILSGWIEGGVSANKLVLSLPYHGYAWTLLNPESNSIGSSTEDRKINEQRRLSRRKHKLKGMVVNNTAATGRKSRPLGKFYGNATTLTVYTLAQIEAATNRFSIENKLGRGGYGPVYKGILADGEQVAVKKLSKASTQGFEEFNNEVMLAAKLQHVNVIRVLGFCIDKEELILVYEYMPNKSLDYYLFDHRRRILLDTAERVQIIEGIIQGLLYLHEYSRLTVIHQDLKASNILLDKNMKPKISDFGMAKSFVKNNDLEANTRGVIGTYDYIHSEYVQRGIYSSKSDVYSFGVLLLQIISGKKVSSLYGLHENLTLLEHAYELMIDGKGMEFMDPTLDNTDSSSILMRCLQVALLCFQENQNDRPSMLEISSMLKIQSTDRDPQEACFLGTY